MEPRVRPVRWVVIHREGLLTVAFVAVMFAFVVAVAGLMAEAY